MTVSVRPILLLLVLVPMVAPDFANANPSTSRPDRALATHGTIPEANALAEEIQAMYVKYEELTAKLNEQENSGRLPYKQLETAAGDFYITRRDAKRLALMGEPVAVEMNSLLLMLDIENAKLMFRYRGSTQGSAQVQKNLAQLKRLNPGKDKELDKIAAAIKSNQLEQSEKRLENIGRELHELCRILTPTQHGPYTKKFFATMSELDSMLTPIRRKQYFDQAKQVAAKELQKVAGFATEARRVQTEIAASGKTKLEDSEEVAAPGAIRHLAKQWGNASAALIRFAAIEWAFSPSPPSKSYESSMNRVAQLESTAKDAIIAVIDAAAVSTPAEKIPKLYSDLLGELSFIDRRTRGSGISKDCEPALQRLAAKSSGLPEQIAAYGLAIEQPLIWRSRFARKHAKQLGENYRDATWTITQDFQVTESNKPKMYGSPSSRKRKLVTPTFATGASWKVADASEFIVGRRVSEQDTLRLYEGSLTALVRHHGVHYSNVAIGMPVEREMEDLKVCLLVNSDHRPLNIDAANAISSAQMQDFLEVGGVIRQLHLEAAVTRFISLPNVAYQIAPLGSLPSIADDLPAVEQACWRLDIEPHWIRHPYFTVAIESKLPKSN
ncbi:MAG: hypothetical protein WBD20_06005 [Pirellulaceae bacterium]